MPVHEHHTVTRQLVGIRHGLLRVAGIIKNDLLNRFSQHPAFGVDVLHRLIGANPQLRPNAAFGPVNGPTTPIFTCAAAGNALLSMRVAIRKAKRFLMLQRPFD